MHSLGLYGRNYTTQTMPFVFVGNVVPCFFFIGLCIATAFVSVSPWLLFFLPALALIVNNGLYYTHFARYLNTEQLKLYQVHHDLPDELKSQFELNVEQIKSLTREDCGRVSDKLKDAGIYYYNRNRDLQELTSSPLVARAKELAESTRKDMEETRKTIRELG